MANKIGILTSGGDAPGMNAAIRAVTRTAISYGMEVYGIKHGYKGIIDEEFIPLKRESVSEILTIGGTFLGSARFPEFAQPEVQDKAVEILHKHGIDSLVVIGGDGTYKGAMALHKKGILVVGIPGTIDNDIVGTDYSIGFYTALGVVTDSLRRIRDTSRSHHRCTIVEIMGNQCGDLTVYGGMGAGADIVVTKETGYNEDEIIKKLNELDKQGKTYIILAMAEKVCDVNALAKKVTELTPYEGRASILGHIQRGGNPEPLDVYIATMMGSGAVEYIHEGKSGICVGTIDNKFTYLPIEEALNKEKKSRQNIYDVFEKTC